MACAKLSPEGEKFDPNLHQAMFEVPNPEVPSGQVVQVVQDGYVIGERVLRPAMVGVAKGWSQAGSALRIRFRAERESVGAGRTGRRLIIAVRLA